MRIALLAGLARVPRKGLRSSAWRRSIQVQNAEAAGTSTLTVAGALSSALRDSIQSFASGYLVQGGCIQVGQLRYLVSELASTALTLASRSAFALSVSIPVKNVFPLSLDPYK